MSNFDDFDEFDDMAIDDDELERIEADAVKQATKEQAIAEFEKNKRETNLPADSAPVSEPVQTSPVFEPEPEEIPVQPAPVPEPEPEEAPASIGSFFEEEEEAEPEEPPVQPQPAPMPEPEPEPEKSSASFSSLFDELRLEAERNGYEEDEPEKAPVDFGDLFGDEEEETVSMPSAMPEPPAPTTSAPTFQPDTVTIPEKPEEADISELFGDEEIEKTTDSVLIADTIVFNDPDRLEMSPSEWAVYTRIPKKAGHTQSPEWLAKMKKEMPSSEMLQQMLNNWIAEKSELFNILKMPSLRESKNWKISDILQDTQVLREIYARSSVLWEETLSQSQGNESAGWLQKVWFTKLLQYAVNYFMICMK